MRIAPWIGGFHRFNEIWGFTMDKSEDLSKEYEISKDEEIEVE